MIALVIEKVSLWKHCLVDVLNSSGESGQSGGRQAGKEWTTPSWGQREGRGGKVGRPFPIDRQKPLEARLPHKRGHTGESAECRREYHNVCKGSW